MRLQQEHAQSGGDAGEVDTEVPPEAPASPSYQESEHVAYFAPCDPWRRPSDYIKYLMDCFEQGSTAPKGKRPRRKTLSRDQVQFVALFAEACDSAWDEERGNSPVERRKARHLVLIGHGGFGKTAIVQEIVLMMLGSS